MHQPPTISSTDKSISRNCHRVWSPTHQRAIKEESKVANHDWIDHQACRLLQNNNAIANLFMMGNYFNELRWKIIRANNLLQLIHQVTIEFRFRKSSAQERFKSNMEMRIQIIVSSIIFRKGFAKFMIPVALFKKFLSSQFIASVKVSNKARCSSKTNELRDIDSIGCRARKSLAFSLSDVVFIMLINVKMPTIVDIYEQDKFFVWLSWALKSFITSGPSLNMKPW